MDFTNIKPCVECRKWCVCSKWNSADQIVVFRIRKLVVKGEDCFEEVDNG